MHPQFQEYLLKVTGASALIKEEFIQSLWSDYGQILRCHLAGADSVIVKVIELPDQQNHPRGWNSSLSHQRKVKSYEVERYWYAHYANDCAIACRVPKLLGTDQQGDSLLLVLEDMNPAGFPLRRAQVNRREVEACLDWLAHFHAQWLGREAVGLWPTGTYWHLATRPDELAALEDQRLLKAAPLIDQKLERCQFKTLVHGDAKLANFCFSEDGERVAAVDFQYVGAGCGMKDVAYFLGSCLSEAELEAQAAVLLDFYFARLQAALAGSSQPAVAIEREWRGLYPFAVADFQRFLQGWSPGHWKVHGYSERITTGVVVELLGR